MVIVVLMWCLRRLARILGGLKIEPHLSPYKVAWINNTNLLVQERYLVIYFLRGFTDQVMCDVLPLKVCYILLGRP